MEPEKPPHDNERIERLRRAMYSRSLSERIHERDRREMTPSQAVVGEDFKREEPGAPKTIVGSPIAIRMMRDVLWWILGASMLFFVGTVGFFAYYFFIGPGSIAASAANIDIAVAGPPQVAGGQASELQIVITNRNRVPLNTADLVIHFPKGTRSPTDFVTEEPTLRQSLGTIEPGGQRQGTIKAVFVGKESEHADVKVDVEYRLEGTSAIYVATATYTMTFSSSPLTVSIDGNSQTIAGQPVQMTITVQSNTSAPVKDVVLKAEYPFGFKFTSSAPSANSSNSFWELGDIAPGGKRTVVVSGTLSGEAADERVFNFTTGTRKSTDVQQIDTPFSMTPFRLTIAQPFLSLAMQVNKGTGSNIIVSPGENVNISINWQNNLSTAITDAVVVARLTGVQIDGTQVRSTDGFYRSTDSTVIWDKKTTNGELTNLKPGSRGTLNFSFEMPTAAELSGVKNPYLEIAVNASGNRVSESGVPQNLQSTARQRIALASDLQFVAQGLYYQSPFGSKGPMPPKAGAETTYAIVFTINNTTNAVSNAIVTATLPPYVRFAGHVSPPTEDISFNQTDNTMTWNLNTIDAGAGLNGTPPRQMAIEIALTPSTSQIGEEPALIQNILLLGTDKALGDCSPPAKDRDTLRTLDRSKDALKGCVTVFLNDVTTNLALPSKSSSAISIGTDKGFTPANATVVK